MPSPIRPSSCRCRAPRRFLLALGASVLVAALPAGAQQPVWKIASDVAFPPYAYLDTASGQPAGLDTEIVAAALDAVGQPHEIRLYPWERAKQMLDSRQVDAVYQFAGTPERTAQYRLAGPIRNGVTVLMARTDGPSGYRSLEDLAGYRFGTVHGFAYTEAFDKAALDKDSGAVTVEQLVKKLVARRVDIIIGDRYQLLDLARRLGFAGRVRIIGAPLAEVPRFIGFGKDGEHMAARFERGLGIIRRNGTLARILAKWERQ